MIYSLQLTMNENIDIRLLGKMPFPPDHIFDSLRKFDPIQVNQDVKIDTYVIALNQIDSFFSKVSYLLPLQTENTLTLPVHSSVRGDYRSPRIL